MTNIPLYTVISFVAISLTARAEDLSTATARLPPGTFTTSAHSDEWRIANALSAGPTTITEHATVVDWPKDGVMSRHPRPGDSDRSSKR
jgi:hypothetical protein